jgi:hypothetical protein
MDRCQSGARREAAPPGMDSGAAVSGAHAAFPEHPRSPAAGPPGGSFRAARAFQEGRAERIARPRMSENADATPAALSAGTAEEVRGRSYDQAEAQTSSRVRASRLAASVGAPCSRVSSDTVSSPAVTSTVLPCG